MAYFAIKAEIRDTRATTFEFTDQKTMYGGKLIREGDEIFLFASENEGGKGLGRRRVIPRKILLAQALACASAWGRAAECFNKIRLHFARPRFRLITLCIT
jgi:hypothetical protein